MRVLTAKECGDWSDQLAVLDDRRRPSRDIGKPHLLRCKFPPSFTQMLWFSRCIEGALRPRTSCLAWVTEWGVFPSNENLHLFYRFRQTYGEVRLLHEAPGHLCLDYENAEVVTLLHLAILFGWDLHLVPSAGYARAFVSHDEWVEVGFDHEGQRQDLMKELQAGGLAPYAPTPDHAG